MTVLAIKSTDPAAPVLSGTVGALIGVLDAGLIVNHVFGTSDDTAFTDQTTEARLEGGTAFNLLLTNVTGARLYIGMPVVFPRVKFDLATVGVGGTYVWEYWNGSAWTTLTVTDGTSGFTADGTVSWTIPGTWATTAVNAVTQYWVRVRASVTPGTNPTINFLTVGGWTKAFTATNQAAYRQGTPSNGFFLQVDDTFAVAPSYANVRGVEIASSTTAGTNFFPVGGISALIKSSTSNAVARSWVIVLSEKLFHIVIDIDSLNTDCVGMSFGDIRSYKTGDIYGTILVAGNSISLGSSNVFPVLIAGLTNTAANTLARNHLAVVGPQGSGKHTDQGKLAGALLMGSAGIAYPNTLDGKLYMGTVWIHETGPLIRGEIPGLWCPLHSIPLTHLDTFSGTGTLTGRTFIAFRQRTSGEVFLETSDTWNV